MNKTTTVFALDMDGSMEPHEGGEWVHADDYFVLEHEKELLVDELRKLAAENASLRKDAEWLSVVEHGLPDAGEEVLAGFWYTDSWLKPEHAKRFMFGRCMIFAGKKSRDFPDGKVWQTFGPSHSQITHWKRVTPPERAAIKETP